MAKAISHSAAILHRAQTGRLPKLCLLWKCGLLIDQLIQAEIGRWLDVNHSKVHSDLRVLDDVLAVYREMLATRPWVRRPDGRAEAEWQYPPVLSLTLVFIRRGAEDPVIASNTSDVAGKIEPVSNVHATMPG